MIIRVDPSLLKGFVSKMQEVNHDVTSLGSNASAAAQGAPSYDGQFGPQVAAIGAEVMSRVNAFTFHAGNLSGRLYQKAIEFEGADIAALDGLTTSTPSKWPTEAELLAQWSKLTGIPVAVLERYLKLGILTGGSTNTLVPVTMLNGLLTWAGLTFSGIQKPSWWPSWLPWIQNQVPSQSNTTIVNNTTSSQQKSKFGEIIEKSNKEIAEKQRADLDAKKQADQTSQNVPKPKYINQYPSRENDGTFLAGQEKSDSCTMASTRMALERATGLDVNESDLRNASNKLVGGYHYGGKWGTTPSSASNLINEQYGKIASANYTTSQSLSDLEKAANNSEGIIVSVKNSEWLGDSAAHSVTVVGVKNENGQQFVLVNDPWPPQVGKRLSVPANDFENAWYGDATYISKK